MTYREYLAECDEFEKAVIVVNFARNNPNYERLSSKAKKELVNNPRLKSRVSAPNEK